MEEPSNPRKRGENDTKLEMMMMKIPQNVFIEQIPETETHFVRGQMCLGKYVMHALRVTSSHTFPNASDSVLD